MNGTNGGVATIARSDYEDILNRVIGGTHYADKIGELIQPADQWKPEKPIKGLTPEQEAKLKRYENFDFANVPDNWKVEHQKLVDNQEKHTDYDIIKAERDKWTNTFTNLTPEAVKTKYDRPDGAELSEAEKEAIKNYSTIKGERDQWANTFPLQKPADLLKEVNDSKTGLKTWTDIFGTETAQAIKNKLDAKPSGGKELTKEEKEAIANYVSTKEQLSKWLISFPFKDSKTGNLKTPQEIRKDYNDLESRLNTAISNLQIEQGKNKGLAEDIKNLKEKLGNPLENLIESKLREVIITEEWNYPYLVKSLESFLNWRSSEDKQKRVLVYKYWNTIRKNIEWLRNRLGGVLTEY